MGAGSCKMNDLVIIQTAQVRIYGSIPCPPCVKNKDFIIIKIMKS